MNITKEIIKKPKTKSWYQNPLFMFFLLVFLFFISVFYKIIKWLYEFVKHKIFRIDSAIKIPKIATLLETDKYHLTKHIIEEDNEHFKLARKFYDLVIGDSIIEIYRLKSHNFSTSIDDFCITDFNYEHANFLYLQRIRATKKGKPTSDLIKLNTTNGEVTILDEIGLFELSDYDDEKKGITGYNLETDEDIVVRVNGLIV